MTYSVKTFVNGVVSQFEIWETREKAIKASCDKVVQIKLSKLQFRTALCAEWDNMTNGGVPLADSSWFIR